MAPRSERFTTASLQGVELHALHWGDEERAKLVLLHGGGANAHWWDHVAPALATKRHVIALDFRGHGDSDYPEQQTPGAFNDDLRALLTHLGDPRCILVGHSMGGGVALAHSAEDAARVDGLVAVDVSRGASQRSKRASRLALALRRTYASRAEAVERYRFLPASAHADEVLRRSIAEHSVRAEPGGRFGFKFDPRWFSIPSRPRPPLSRIQCPTLLLRGSESPLLTQAGAEALVEELRDASAQTIEAAGHHVQLDQPAAFIDAILTFIDRISRS